jgi:SAM-dependent methyltransferase
MTDSRLFEERYRTGNTPWDHGMPDFNLLKMVADGRIAACKALDVGCGTGGNAIWLAQQGFDVTGCDISPTAAEKAHMRAKEAGAECAFCVLDFLGEEAPGAPFGFAFDRGCLHSFDTIAQRKEFARRMHLCLEDGGLWLNLSGSSDGLPREIGPPRLRAEELVAVVEPYFEIRSLAAGYFGSDQTKPPEAWICLLRKRNLVS